MKLTPQYIMKLQTLHNKKAVVLLSGGVDSSTTLYYALKNSYKCHCLIFDYGQRHKKEVESAVKIAEKNNLEYHIIKITLPWKGSSLIDETIPLPKHKLKEIGKRIPSTYVPARNTIFLSFATSYAETINADTIFIGANIVDYSGYPDCRPNYLNCFEKLIKVGTKKGIEGKEIKIEAPFLKMKKSEIIKTGMKLGVPYELTWSCYSDGEKPCMECDACLLRKKAFEEANVIDPLYNIQ